MGWYNRTFEEEARRAGERLGPFRAGLLFAREIAYPDFDPTESEAALGEYFFDRLGFGGRWRCSKRIWLAARRRQTSNRCAVRRCCWGGA